MTVRELYTDGASVSVKRGEQEESVLALPMLLCNDAVFGDDGALLGDLRKRP